MAGNWPDWLWSPSFAICVLLKHCITHIYINKYSHLYSEFFFYVGMAPHTALLSTAPHRYNVILFVFAHSFLHFIIIMCVYGPTIICHWMVIIIACFACVCVCVWFMCATLDLLFSSSATASIRELSSFFYNHMRYTVAVCLCPPLEVINFGDDQYYIIVHCDRTHAHIFISCLKHGFLWPIWWIVTNLSAPICAFILSTHEKHTHRTEKKTKTELKLTIVAHRHNHAYTYMCHYWS